MASDDAPGPEWARAVDLVTFGQVRAWLGVARARGNVITNDYRFPRPWFVSEDGKTRLWRRAEVEAWLDENRAGWRGQPS